MNIALLKCDSVQERFHHIDGDFPDMFARFLDLGHPGVRITTFDVTTGEYPDLARGYDGFVCTGSGASTYDDEDWIKELKSYVQLLYSRGEKFVGICFGHQLIGESLGGKVVQSGRGWGIGVQEARVQKTAAWMRPECETFAVPVSYKDQVIELPPNGETLAANDHCPHFMIGVGGHFLGIQGHPEISRHYVEALLRSRGEQLGEKVVSDGLQSLEREVHSDVLAMWTVNFLRA